MSAVAQPLTLEDIEKYPLISQVSMSQDGSYLVGLVADPTNDGEEQAAAYWDISGTIDTSKPVLPSAITPSEGKMKFRSATALKKGKSIWLAQQTFTGLTRGCIEGDPTRTTKTFVTKAYLGNEMITKIDDMPAGRNNRCTDFSGGVGIVSTLPKSDSDIMISRVGNSRRTEYYRHNLETSKEKLMLTEKVGESYIIDSLTGEPFGTSDLEFKNGEWTQFVKLLDTDSGKYTLEDALTVEIKDRFVVEVVAPQPGAPGKFFVATDKFSDKVALYVYDMKTDSFSDEPVFAHPDFSVAHPSEGGSTIIRSARDDDFGSVIGFRYLGAAVENYFIDSEFQSIVSGLEQAFDGRRIGLAGYNGDMSRILFTVSDTDYPTAYYLLIDKAQVAAIGSTRPWIAEKEFERTELVYYTARDGLKIPALLTLPKGWTKADGPLPTLIHPHGGPWVRDYASGFNWQVQYFASNGFAVLQPNYRGSVGFGREHWLAGDNEWGQKMQDDKDDGAAWLVNEGIADPDQIAIWGFSYGGFAAMAAVVRPDGPYKCAIPGAGVSNLTRLGNLWGDNRVQRVFQGRTVTGMDPMDNTKKASIPALVIHGDRDVRVPLFHSRDFYNAIKRDQPQSELVVVKDMPHGYPWPEHRRETTEATMDFLKGTCGFTPSAG